MARVIEEVPVKEKQITCEHCGRTIAYAPKDLRNASGRNIDGSRWTQERLKCPGNGCGKDILVNST